MKRVALLAVWMACAVVAWAQTPPITITTTSPLPTGYTGLPYPGITFTATTNPPNQTVTWSFVQGSGNPPPGLTLFSNGNFTGTFSANAVGSYTFTVQAQISSGAVPITARMQFVINVIMPQITITGPSSIPNGVVNQPYFANFTASSNTPIGIVWSATGLPPGLTMNPSTGVLSGTPTNSGSYTVPVTATLANTNYSVTQNYALAISAGQVVITTTALPPATVGQPYSIQLQTNPAGAIWTLVSNTSALPPGITFNSSGLLSGTPTMTGAYPLLFQADVRGLQGSQITLTLYVTNGPLGIVQTSIPVAILSTSYTTTLTATGGLPPYTWSTTNTLGLSIDPVLGTITGTPNVTTPGPYNLPVTVTDATGTKVSVNFSLFVAAPLSVATTSLPNGSIGSAYTQVLQAAGGQAPYTWSLAPNSGPLPTGLSLSSGATISGVPTTNGLSSFTVQVTDNGKRVATKVLSITIGAPATITITTASLPDDVVGVAYSQTLAASGGTPPYVWTIVSGSPPAGLALDQKTGIISGTPTATGTSTFTIQVTDSTVGAPPLIAQKAFTLTIAVALTISTTSLPNGTVGVAYSQTLQASGGRSPYTWTIGSGTPPAGLTLSTGGVISGTPTAAGTSTFVVVATDAGAQSARQSLTILITPPPPIVITPAVLSATIGTAFSQALGASGGTPPYTFTVTGLPAGLTFANGTISGTPTTAGQFTLSVRVTDASANPQTSVGSIILTVNLPSVPPVTFSVGSSSTQPPVTLCFGGAFPLAATGTLSLSFQPSSAVATGTDQSIQFVSPGTGSTVMFTVPQCGTANPTSAMLSMGTVAGTITITPKITANGTDLTPANLTPQTITIPAAPPVITSVKLTSANGVLSVMVIGYSSTREVSSGLFHFVAATGSTLSQSDITVPLNTAFTTWYANSASNAYGGQFGLTVPFTVQGSTSSIIAVTVTLTNSRGTSAAVPSQ